MSGREAAAVALAACALLVSTASCRKDNLAAAPLEGGGSSAAPASHVDADVGCGEGCWTFADAGAAFAYLLDREKPDVLAVGEAHAQKDQDVGSTTSRFERDMLPVLEGRASHLIIELWVGNPSCAKKVAAVATRQQEVTAPQATSNQNELLRLGATAKRLGIQPRALVPGCVEYDLILDAGAGDVDAMLQMIARLTQRDLLALASADAGVRPRMVVAYGGALHNDVRPRPGHEAWSFGPGVRRALPAKRYVALDLIVPEAVKDTEGWRAQPWYTRVTALRADGGARLLLLDDGSYALVFPRSG